MPVHETAKFYSLYSTTKILVADARELARSGKKDQARDHLRFVRNSGIIPILKMVEFHPALRVDVAHLEWEVSELEHEVHPETKCDQTNDIKAIRLSLELIAHYVSQQLGGGK